MKSVHLVAGVFALGSIALGEESKEPLSKGVTVTLTETYEDELVKFKTPKGAKVDRLQNGQVYIVYFDETEFFYLNLLGKAEPEVFSRQRTDAAHKDALGKMGREHDDGESKMTVQKVTDVTRHEIGRNTVFLFQMYMLVAEAKKTTSGLSTIGFGTIDRSAVWFQHTGAKPATHPDAINAFLKECEIKSVH